MFKLWTLFTFTVEITTRNKICRRHSTSPPLCYLAFLTLLVLLLLSFILSSVENVTYFEGVYFAVVTFSTVGLGDVVPRTTVGKLK